MSTLVLHFLGGLIILIIGADILVRGATHLAAAFGVSPLVIGLTIVAIGTASPEIAVSLKAAAVGQGDLTLGNVLGSNIFNILFILGITSMVAPIVIAEQLIRKDAPIMLGVSLVTFVLAQDGKLSSVDGLILTIGLIAYTIFAMKQSRKESMSVQAEYAQEFAPKVPYTTRNIVIHILFIVVGLGLLVLGSNWLVESASQIAKSLGVSELVIGLTIVAIGTSLPEVATSVMAVLKKESDIAVGNAVGSNIFNLLGVLGIGAFFSPAGITVSEQVLGFDFLVMIFVALVTLPIFYIDNRISRMEGGLLLVYYSLYIGYIILAALHSSIVPIFSAFLIIFASLTFIILTGIAVRHMRR